jgi:hypothetical protein
MRLIALSRCLGSGFGDGSLCRLLYLCNSFGAFGLMMPLPVVLMSFMIRLLLACIFGGRLLVFVVFQNLYLL